MAPDGVSGSYWFIMRFIHPLFAAVIWLLVIGCAPSKSAKIDDAPISRFAFAGPNSLVNLHLKLEVDPATGVVSYFGFYDGQRNLLGPGGITTSIVGMEPPELRGQLRKLSSTEIRYIGMDQNRIVWEKTWKIEETAVHVTIRIENRRDEAFDAIIYSLADLPDATFSGDNRDLHITTPKVSADFHAFIDNPHFPGEQMSPYAMRSDSKHLEPGQVMEFRMTWTLKLPRTQNR